MPQSQPRYQPDCLGTETGFGKVIRSVWSDSLRPKHPVQVSETESGANRVGEQFSKSSREISSFYRSAS